MSLTQYQQRASSELYGSTQLVHRRNARPETDGKSLRGPRLPSFSYSPFAESREQRNLTRDFILWIRFFVVVFKTMRNKYFSEKNDVKMVKIDVIAICFSGWRDNPKWDYMINYSLAYALFYTELNHYSMITLWLHTLLYFIY